MSKNGVSKKVFMGVRGGPGVTRGENPGMPLHPIGSRYEYIGQPVVAQGIFKGMQTSPWIKVPRPSDWYRGPWQVDRTQHAPFRNQPRPLSFVERGAGHTVPAGTHVSGCGACDGLGAIDPATHYDTYGAAAIGILTFMKVKGSTKKKAVLGAAAGVASWFILTGILYPSS